MIVPDYRGGSIVNLMSSIINARGGKSPYPEAHMLPGKSLKGKKIVLFMFDGLGYWYLQKYGQGSFLQKNCKGRLTAAFPATTPVGVTTYYTGLPPQQTAVTGWFSYFKELGLVGTPIRHMSRFQQFPLGDIDKGPLGYLKKESFSYKIKGKCAVVIDKRIAFSPYNRIVSGKASIYPHKTLEGCIRQTIKAVNDGSFFTYAYWGDFDGLCHEIGYDRKKVKEHFLLLDRLLKRLAVTLRKKNTILIVCADHGHMVTERKERLWLSDHEKLNKTLIMPLCGEPRLPYCYIGMGKEKEFLSYVKENMSKYCIPIKGVDAIKKEWFGLFNPHPRLQERVGDYILVMKDNFVFRDLMPGSKDKGHRGFHGGVSEKEMYVPLIVVS
ncbi:MAG: alkaline phosphatase family protein [Nanoarchaeota archaeon]